jgi:hypothetical protein
MDPFCSFIDLLAGNVSLHALLSGNSSSIFSASPGSSSATARQPPVGG